MNSSSDFDGLNQQLTELRQSFNEITRSISSMKGEMKHIAETVKELVASLRAAVYLCVACLLVAMLVTCVCAVTLTDKHLDFKYKDSHVTLE